MTMNMLVLAVLSPLFHSLLLLPAFACRPADAFRTPARRPATVPPPRSGGRGAPSRVLRAMAPDAAAVGTPAAAAAPERIDGLASPALEKYDTCLLDMWGVMHDGSLPYAGALRTVKELKKAGKRLIILSNSSQRREKSEQMLVQLGFDLSDFDNIITSGDVSHHLLRNDAEALGIQNWDVLADLVRTQRTNVFVFGSGNDDAGYCTSAGWTLSAIEEADLIVARGTFTINDGTTVVSKTEDEAEYWRVTEESLATAARRKVPMLVTNPDKVRPEPGLPPMPGSIGDTYERFVWTTHCNDGMTEEGARDSVRRIGKPFRAVYDVALGAPGGGGGDRARALMVGDALETDVLGGRGAGVDALWVVADGVHAEEAKEGGAAGALEGFNKKAYATYAYGERVAPRYATDHFRW